MPSIYIAIILYIFGGLVYGIYVIGNPEFNDIVEPVNSGYFLVFIALFLVCVKWPISFLHDVYLNIMDKGESK